MKVYGQLERAQVENVAALPTAGIKGRVVFLTTDSRFYIDNGTAFKKIVETDSTDTLTNKTLTTPTLTSPVINGSLSGTAIVDEDNMISNSDTKVPTQQSVKAYVDTVGGNLVNPATDNAIPRFDGTAGLLQNSGVVVDDSNNVSGIVGQEMTGALTQSDISTPSTPASNKQKIYAKRGHIYKLNSSASEKMLTELNQVYPNKFYSNFDLSTTSFADNYRAVAYGLKTLVFVSDQGIRYLPIANNAMISAKTVVNMNSVRFANGIFMAVGDGGEIHTSSNGSSFTTRTEAETNSLQDCAYSPSLNRWVIVSSDGTNRVQTSDDNGVTWTVRTAAEANSWMSVVWAEELSLFVAVSSDGTNRVMTSSDGITWTARSAASASAWRRVCYSPTLRMFVAVATSGSSTIMTSTDGITWSSIALSVSYFDVCWSEQRQLFLTVSDSIFGRASFDGVTWQQLYGVVGNTSSRDSAFNGVCYCDDIDMFVTVATSGATMVASDKPDWGRRPDNSFAIVKQVESTGVNGGDFTSGAFRDVALNTVVEDPTWLSLSGGVMTISRGRYRVKGFVVGFDCGAFISGFYDNSNAIMKAYGTSEYSDTTGNVQARSELDFVLEVTTGRTDYKLQGYCGTTKAASGLGRATSLGMNETYSTVTIEKLE